MIEFLRDGLWQFIGVLLTLAGFVASIYFFIKQKSKKTLAYDVKDIVPLISVHKSMRGRLRIFLEENQVNSASMSSVIFANRGNVPITRDDYDETLTATFSGEGKIITCDVFDKTPASINVDPIIDDNVVKFNPFLLNPGESFAVRAIIINGKADVKVAARIIGGDLKSFSEIDDTIFRRSIRMVRPELTFYVFAAVATGLATTSLVVALAETILVWLDK